MSIKQPMESIFVKGIKSGGPADVSGLQKGVFLRPIFYLEESGIQPNPIFKLVQTLN